MSLLHNISEQEFIDIVKCSSTYRQIALALHMSDNSTSYEKIKKKIKDVGLKFNSTYSGKPTYTTTNDEFKQVVENATSIRQALLSLGLNATGANYKSFHKRVKLLNISTEHFAGQLWSKGKKVGPKRSIESYLSNEFPINSNKLRKRLLLEGIFPHKCFGCQATEKYGDPIPLELDHINGNSNDNSIHNLRVLCPTCHAFTKTWRGRNKKS